MNITLRYEIPRGYEGVNEEIVHAPENWADMSDDERHQWCVDAIGDGLGNYISTSYEWEGME